jgi:hypothetical protein
MLYNICPEMLCFQGHVVIKYAKILLSSAVCHHT